MLVYLQMRHLGHAEATANRCSSCATLLSVCHWASHLVTWPVFLLAVLQCGYQWDEERQGVFWNGPVLGWIELSIENFNGYLKKIYIYYYFCNIYSRLAGVKIEAQLVEAQLVSGQRRLFKSWTWCRFDKKGDSVHFRRSAVLLL